jgi:hypothetical protein
MRSVLPSKIADRAGPEPVDRSRALPGEDRPPVVHAGKWRGSLPEDCWPRRFPTEGYVWRRDVFEVAAKWRADRATARHLLAAVLMWQSDGSPTARRHALRTLADDPTGARTEAALRVLRSDRIGPADLRSAYLAFRTDCRLAWFDGDSATALLYFAGYRRGVPDVQPLLINAEIAARIPASAGVSTSANRGSSLEWMRYLNWAAALVGNDVEPELVEMDLSAGGLRYGTAQTPPAFIPRQRRGSALFQAGRGARENSSVTADRSTHAAMPSIQ